MLLHAKVMASWFFASVMILASGPPQIPAHTWGLSAEAGTWAPVDFMVGVTIDTPLPWLRLGGHVGRVPAPYIDMAVGTAVSGGLFDANTGAAVRASLDSATVLRGQARLYPFRRHVFYVGAGASLMGLGGAVTTEAILAAALGTAPPTGGTAAFYVGSTLLVADVEVGYEFRLGSRWRVRPAVGYLSTVAATTDITPAFNPGIFAGAVESIVAPAENLLDQTYVSFIRSPTVTLAVGRQF